MKDQITRRDFIWASSAASAGMIMPGCNFISNSKRKPNLLFIWTDEQRADTMAVYGNKKIKTPALNKLAEQSFVFLKSYVTQAVSTPSRCSVMTGLYPHTSGLTANNIPLSDDVLCFPELLNDPEYKTAYMGKWHLGDEIFAQHGFQDWISIEDEYSSYYTEGKDRAARSSYHHWLVEKGYKPGIDNTFSRNFAASLPIEHCKPKFLEEKACRFLKEHQDNPFVLYINFLEPHMPFTGPLNDLYDPEDIDLPGNFNDPLEENVPLRYQLQRESSRKRYGPDEKSFRKLISRYWGMVTQIDRSVGVILQRLEQLGLDENTIVVYTSDHGDMMGSHQMVEKTVMYEESVRVPFLMKVPFITTGQTIIPQRISHIDIVPTLLELMNKPVPAFLQGKSLKPVLENQVEPKGYVFIEWTPDEAKKEGNSGSSTNKNDEVFLALISSTRTVIAPDGWKLCLSDTDKSQLFNLNKDPLETTNLFYEPEWKDKINFLVYKIKEWQKITHDQLMLKL